MSVSKAWSVVCDDCETDTWCAGEERSSLLELVSKGWTFPFSDTGEALSFCPNCKYITPLERDLMEEKQAYKNMEEGKL
jgi:hypothetical protein